MSHNEQAHLSDAQTGGIALVVGASGIAGSALVEKLAGEGWQVLAMSRTEGTPKANVRYVPADLSSPQSLKDALADVAPTQVFFTAWARQDTEEANIRVNAAMLRNLLEALAGKPVAHVALMTGLKHYLGPFEAYGEGEMPDTPFHEEEPRLPVNNFYYAQEDELWAAAAAQGFTWSVHRSHTVIGHAVGNAMNMGLTLAAYAALCKESGRRFIFPGSETHWNSLTDMTDAGLLADHMVWAATSPNGANEAFNVVNGDVFRWRWMWQQLAAHFGVEAEGFRDQPRPLAVQMAGADAQWRELVAAHGLAEPRLDRVASWWHTDGDLGRNLEVVADMSKSRIAGFTGYRRTLDAFTDLFERYRADKLIP
ncbi:SDR family oxidoreductase [Arthrobacter sp. TMT4-20]